MEGGWGSRDSAVCSAWQKRPLERDTDFMTNPVVRVILAHFPCLEGGRDGDLIMRT